MESQDHPLDAPTAAAELAALQGDRAALADRVVQPWWYDVLLGVLVFVFLGSYATHDWRAIAAAWVLCGLGCWGLVTVYKRLTGMWISGFRPGPTRRALSVWFAACVAWVVAALVDAAFGLPLLLVAVSAGCGLALAFVSRWWTRIYVAELRGEL